MKVKIDYILCLFTGLTVFLFFSHTLNYPWKHFDEQIIYNETIWPVPQSLSELLNYLKYFGINSYFEASNPFYSSVSNIRNDPFNNLITLIVSCLFQKNQLFYHFLSLLLHVLNSCFLFLTLNKIANQYFNNPQTNKLRLFVVTMLTLLWSLHPANVESLLLTTNWSAILSYTFCNFLIFYFVYRDQNKNTIAGQAQGLPLHFLCTFILYIFPVFSSEQTISLPLILFSYLLSMHFLNRMADARSAISEGQTQGLPLLQNAIKHTFISTLSLWIVFGLFIIHFLFSPTKENILSSTYSFQSTLERIFWLSPQIFFHFIKLIVFPLHLSIDQTDLVNLSHSLMSGYSVFCFLLMYLIILLLGVSFFFMRKNFFLYFFIVFAPFLIAMLPFLHAISPTYCLASERYLYFPTLILILGFSHLLFFILSRSSSKKNILIVITVILAIFSTRAYIRTFDWKDSIALFISASKEAKTDLFKGLRLEMAGAVFSSYYTDHDSKLKGKEYIEKGLFILENSMRKLEQENKPPKVIKEYGLDPKTIQAKTAYLIAFTRFGINKNIQEALQIMRPHMQDLTVIDTQILDFYLGLLFATKNLDEADILIHHTLTKKISPTIYVIAAELYKQKYNNLIVAEELLKKSFKYFPYDQITLENLVKFYSETNNPEKFAYFMNLHRMRTHTKL